MFINYFNRSRPTTHLDIRKRLNVSNEKSLMNIESLILKAPFVLKSGFHTKSSSTLKTLKNFSINFEWMNFSQTLTSKSYF